MITLAGATDVATNVATEARMTTRPGRADAADRRRTRPENQGAECSVDQCHAGSVLSVPSFATTIRHSLSSGAVSTGAS